IFFQGAIFLRDLKARKWDRTRFVGDVDQPQEGWRRRTKPHDILVGDQHDAAAAKGKGNRKRRVGRPRKGRAPVQSRNEFRLADIVDAEDHEAAVPVARVQAIASPHWMVTAMRGSFPGRLLAAGDPLSGHPPAADLFRARWILKVDDRNHIADIAVEFRGAVHVSTVEREPVHPACGPGGNARRLRWIAHIEYLEPALEIGIDAADGKHFAIDQHHTVFDAHLVRQRALRNADACKLARFRGIGNVDNGGAVRRLDVSDISDVVADNHLSAARTERLSGHISLTTSSSARNAGSFSRVEW